MSASDISMRVETVSAPVRQQVLKALREAILSGRFAPGQRLVEKELCEILGVSKPPVREALRELEVEGLVDNVPNRGPEVARLNKVDAVGIYQVRGVLEGLAAKLFVQVASDAEVAALRKAAEQIAIAYAGGDAERNLEAKTKFYDILMLGARNNMLPSIIRTMNARINLLRRLSLGSPERLPESLRELFLIVEAIERRDAEGAFAASLYHVEKSADVAIANIPD